MAARSDFLWKPSPSPGRPAVSSPSSEDSDSPSSGLAWLAVGLVRMKLRPEKMFSDLLAAPPDLLLPPALLGLPSSSSSSSEVSSNFF